MNLESILRCHWLERATIYFFNCLETDLLRYLLVYVLPRMKRKYTSVLWCQWTAVAEVSWTQHGKQFVNTNLTRILDKYHLNTSSLNLSEEEHKDQPVFLWVAANWKTPPFQLCWGTAYPWTSSPRPGVVVSWKVFWVSCWACVSSEHISLLVVRRSLSYFGDSLKKIAQLDFY